MADIKVSQLNSISAQDVNHNDLLHCVSVSASESRNMHMSVVGNSTIRTSIGPIDPTNSADYQAKGITSYSSSNVMLPFYYEDGVNRNYIYNISFGKAFDAEYVAPGLKFTTGLIPVNAATGWSTNGNGAFKLITHNLGTVDINISIFAAIDSSGNELSLVSGYHGFQRSSKRSRKRYGVGIHSITTTSFVVQLAKDGYLIPSTTGDDTTEKDWKYIRIVCRK